MTDENQEPNETLRESLARLRDTVALRAHLFTQDAKDAWDELGPWLDDIERRLRHKAHQAGAKADEAEVKAELGWMEARDRLRHVEDVVQDLVGKAAEKGGDAREAWDRARVKAHLASLDAKDTAKEVASDVSSGLSDAKRWVEARIEDLKR